jgi:hypothetical protein
VGNKIERISNMSRKKTKRVKGSSGTVCHLVVAPDNVFEHPANAEEFEAVAALAARERQADKSRFVLPPLWPMLLHMVFADIPLPPLGGIMEPVVRNAFGCVVLSKADAAKLDRVSIIPFVRALRSSIHRHQHSGVVGIRKVLLREKSSRIDEVIAAGAVPLLAALLHDDNRPCMQHEAAWALRMVAGGTTWATEFQPAWVLTSYWTDTTDQTARIVNTPEVVASLVRLLRSADHNICEHAMRVLGNIARVSASHRDVLLERGVLTELMLMMSRSDLSADPLTVRRHVTWATACLCCDTLPPLSAIVTALPLFVEAIRFPDTDLAVTAMRRLEFFCSGTREHMSAVVDHGALPAILCHAASGVWELVKLAVSCLGYIFRGDNHHIAAAIELGTIATLCTVLQARSGPSWREEDVLWALSNIAGGNAQRINALLQADVFSLIANAVGGREEPSRVRSQRIVTKALRNASPADRTAIIGSPSFQALLTAASTRRILLVGLEGIDYAVTHAFAAVEAVTSLADLGVSASALQKIKEPRVQYHAARINALIHGEAPEDSVGEAGARRGRKKSAKNSPRDEVSTE